MFDRDIDQLAERRYPLSVNDVELGFAERWGHFVLDHFHAGSVTHDFRSILDGSDATDVHPYGGVKLERTATCGRFRAAEHHADLHTNLVDEDQDRLRAVDGPGQLPKSLTHQTSLKPDMTVAHVPFNLCPRNKCRH